MLDLVWSVSMKVSAPYVITGSCYVTLSLQADGKVSFEEIPVFGVCLPLCYDYSFHHFVLVLFLEAVVFQYRNVAFNSYTVEYWTGYVCMLKCLYFKMTVYTGNPN